MFQINLRFNLILVFTAIFFLSSCAFQGKEPSFLKKSPGRAAYSSSSMVVTENEISTKIATDVLSKGGNAFDAAIAASFTLSVIRPHSTGIGGGGFFLLKKANSKEPIFLDARERAPSSMSQNSLEGVSVKDPTNKGMLIGVPGLVLGLEEIYKKYGSGRVSWNELLAPSIELAERGFKVYDHLDEAIKISKEKLGLELPSNYIKNDLVVNEKLATTLREISKNGSNSFYNGYIAEDIVRSSNKAGSQITLNDLKNYRVKYREPAEFSYNDAVVYTAPLPSSGGVCLGQILKLNEHYQNKDSESENYKSINKERLEEFYSPRRLWFLSEAMNTAFYDRAMELGDPDFSNIDQAKLISNSYIKNKYLKINKNLNEKQKKETGEDSIKTEEPFPTSTTHFSIIDKEGNVVSSTHSINLYFGSGVFAKESGVILNNTLDDFSKKNDKANAFGLVGKSSNYPGPSKTPLSSMSPTMVMKEEKPFLVLGSPGGPRIISAIAQTLINRISLGYSLDEAIKLPRIHRQWKPDTLFIEKSSKLKDAEDFISKYGVESKETNYSTGNVSAIEVKTDGDIIGIADPRRDGFAEGEVN